MAKKQNLRGYPLPSDYKKIAKVRINSEEMTDIELLKRALKEQNLERLLSKIAYLPAAPIVSGIEKEVVVEEALGVRVIRLVSAPEE